LMFLDQDVESMYFLKSFFFQAEDGIRDRNVTGVQTCALPISPRVVPWVVPVQVQPAVLPPARQVIPQPTRSVAPQAVPRAARPAAVRPQALPPMQRRALTVRTSRTWSCAGNPCPSPQRHPPADNRSGPPPRRGAHARRHQEADQHPRHLSHVTINAPPVPPTARVGRRTRWSASCNSGSVRCGGGPWPPSRWW